jgi:sigma-B regulation protein RsbU (phosphoserine phosphatase)
MPPGIFATACWLSIDPARLDIVYARAGHCPPIIVRADGVEETLDSGGGLPLGLLRDVAYPEGCARLGPGDTLFVYTDGLTEAMNERGEMFGDERLRRILTRLCRVDAATLSERMLESFDAHRGEIAAADDTTWVVVRARLC